MIEIDWVELDSDGLTYFTDKEFSLLEDIVRTITRGKERHDMPEILKEIADELNPLFKSGQIKFSHFTTFVLGNYVDKSPAGFGISKKDIVSSLFDR